MKSFAKIATAVALTLPGVANAAVTFTGNFIGVTINNVGTFSSLKHDKTGTKNYGVNDYITPGTPHDGFSLNSTQTGFIQNENSGSFAQIAGGPSTLLTGAAALGYDYAATWSGANSFLAVVNQYFYNDGDERIRVVSTITALSNLSSLSFARSVDPDPDVNTNGNYDTKNQRGNSLFGATDFVGSAGAVSGLTLALINNSGNTYVHNTTIDPSCCSNINPTSVLAGNGINSNTDDDGLNMAWLIGNLSTGSSAKIEYFYAVGDKIEVVGGPGAVPEPATWAMMIGGFGMVGGSMRYRRRKTTVTFA